MCRGKEAHRRTGKAGEQVRAARRMRKMPNAARAARFMARVLLAAIGLFTFALLAGMARPAAGSGFAIVRF